jgi:hypothetical protein
MPSICNADARHMPGICLAYAAESSICIHIYIYICICFYKYVYIYIYILSPPLGPHRTPPSINRCRSQKISHRLAALLVGHQITQGDVRLDPKLLVGQRDSPERVLGRSRRPGWEGREGTGGREGHKGDQRAGAGASKRRRRRRRRRLRWRWGWRRRQRKIEDYPLTSLLC